jgi:glycyl-tRNA synthetase alpha chain
MNFQQIILSLHRYWADYGCVIQPAYDVEVGAGTCTPATFLRALGPDPWKVGYVQPSRRPTDGRYGDNPNRLQRHHQYQVIVKPAPEDSQGIYVNSLEALGIDVKRHDVRFVEDDWESPSLGATGMGWEVWLDGMEITQFTYFQQMGGIELDPISLEITYGLERIAMLVQGKDSVYDIDWAPGFTYGDVCHRDEVQFSRYNFDLADTDACAKVFEIYETECLRLLDEGQALPAYDCALKCSHVFNLLDARGSIGVVQRTRYMGRVRRLCRRCATTYLKDTREQDGDDD